MHLAAEAALRTYNARLKLAEYLSLHAAFLFKKALYPVNVLIVRRLKLCLLASEVLFFYEAEAVIRQERYALYA